MKRILASVAVLGLMAIPALAATKTPAKPATAQTNQKPAKKIAANTAKTDAKTNVKTNPKKAK
jgi:hypothetical protein